jgi:hypothetical protein
VNFEGRSVAIVTSTHREAGASRMKQGMQLAAGGGAMGSLIGTVAGGKKGFFLGAGLGAAGGIVVQALRGPAAVRLPAESLLLFTLQSPITVETAY